MTRVWLALVLVGLGALPASAHFLWVVPQPDGRTAHVIVSETLAADSRVDAGIVARARLVWRDAGGHETPLALTRAGYVLTTPLAGRGLVFGHADLGVRPSGQRAYRLHYYPKTIVGDAFAREATVTGAPIDIVPVGGPGAMRLKVLVEGAPAAGVDVNLLLPDGSEETAQTGPDGLTAPLAATGRYGAWARLIQPVKGTHDGTPFDQTRHYTMLVVDAGTASTSAVDATRSSATTIGTLPVAASSFGAAVHDDWLYVYGGHVIPTHSYSVDAVSGRFARRRLAEDAAWESLPDGPPAQGMNLVAHDGRIYRVGGMQPRNQPGAPADTWSLADVARFDPARGAWESLPALPIPRSSHDVVVVGSSLVVVGGWSMRGAGAEPVWLDTIDVLDLSASTLAWRSVPQPFKRRALIAAAVHGKVFVLGGFEEGDSVVRTVSIYDVASSTWTEGPALPGGRRSGFGPAAAVLDGRLFVSIDDGSIHRLNDTWSAWEPVGRATPRIVHRMVGHKDRLVVIGGASRGGNSDLIETVAVRP